MSESGDVWVECSLRFKGNMNARLWNDMTISEAVHDIIHSGNYDRYSISKAIVCYYRWCFFNQDRWYSYKLAGDVYLLIL